MLRRGEVEINPLDLNMLVGGGGVGGAGETLAGGWERQGPH